MEEYLKEYLSYDPETGLITWAKDVYRRSNIGQEAGYLCPHTKYRRIKANYKLHLAHRVAWFLHYGVWPNVIDHINGIRDDNRICNIRSVTTRENCSNYAKNRAGKLVGATLRANGRWKAHINIQNKVVHLGYFDTEQEAHQAYMKALSSV